MANDIEVLEQALVYFKETQRVKEANRELLDHLIGSIYWLLEYSEKYDITLPKKEQLKQMLKNTDFLIANTRIKSQTNRKVTEP